MHTAAARSGDTAVHVTDAAALGPVLAIPGATLIYLGGQAVAAILWAADLAQRGADDRSWIAPTVVAVGGVLVGLAGKMPAIIRAWKEPPKAPRKPRGKRQA